MHGESSILSVRSVSDESLPYASSLLALARCDLLVRHRDTSELLRLVARELVHGLQGDVEGASSGVINGKDVDALVLVRELPAGAALCGVPATNGEGTADQREAGEGANRLVA